jgi:glucose/arabinose dehydrogenase
MICIFVLIVTVPLIIFYTIPDTFTINTFELPLTFDQPVYLLSKNSNLYVVEEEGRIIEITMSSDTRTVYEKTVYMDITAHVNSSGIEQGLLCVAFEPQTDRIYATFTNHQHDLVLYRYKNQEDIKGEMLLNIPNPHHVHYGGWIGFGTDQYLYMAIGDIASPGDPSKTAQNLQVFAGKVIRVDVSGEVGYTIPTSNPFVQSPDGLKEIWAIGLRNPWRCSMDGNNQLWIGNVGYSYYEEINVLSKAGENFGWPCWEAVQHVKKCDPPPGALSKPYYYYSHNSYGAAVIGGYVYTGKNPHLQDKYIFGDFVSGNVWIINVGVNPGKAKKILQFPSVSSFGQDINGNIFICEYINGKIYKII